ncbi:PE domain-containing protein [Mycobacterium servetii]|uniref:PE domain-containing protein n=1 Tax=Mycobacterium servetii TaxID=3237418 RepID=A0ABV4C4J9_9MYCO
MSGGNMSFVVAVPETIQVAAQDLAGIRSVLAEAITTMAPPTTGVVPAAGDEVSAAVAATFGNFGKEFQSLSVQAQAFHAEFVDVINAGAGAYLSTELANAEQTLANAVTAPAQAVLGLGGASGLGSMAAAGGGTPAAGSLLGGLTGLTGSGGLLSGLTGGLTGSGGLLGGLTGPTGSGGLLSGLTGGLTGSGGLLSGLTGGLTGSGGLLSGLTGGLTGSGGLLSGLTGGLTGSGGLLGGLTGPTGSGGLLSGLTGGLTGSGGLLSGLTGDLTGIFGGLGNLGSILSVALPGLPGLPGLLGGLGNSLTGLTNSLLSGLVHLNIGDAGPYFAAIAGPYEELFYNTWNNLQNLGARWLADPFPFLRQFITNQMGYAQTVAAAFGNASQSVEAHAAALPTALQAAAQAFSAGNYSSGLSDVETGLQNVFSGVGPTLTPISAIPGHIAQNMTNVVQLATNTSITPYLDVSLLPQGFSTLVSASLNYVVGLPVVFGVALLGPPVSMLEAAGSSAAAFTAALQAGDPGGAIAALIDAPAVIANGFLNGQTTFSFALSLPNITVSGVLDAVANVSAVGNLPLDGLLVPPGHYSATVTISPLLNTIGVGPVVLDLGPGGTQFSGLLPFLVNYAPEQLAQAIGASASPAPLISLPL